MATAEKRSVPPAAAGAGAGAGTAAQSGLVATIVASLLAALAAATARILASVRSAVVARYPDLTESEIEEVVADERGFADLFVANSRARVEAALRAVSQLPTREKELAQVTRELDVERMKPEPDPYRLRSLERTVEALRTGPGARERAVRGVLQREEQYARQHARMAMARAVAGAERAQLHRESPWGAYWELSPHVREHTVGCLIMGGKAWPWAVLNRIHPPRHGGCPCRLRSIGAARAEGLITGLPDLESAIIAASGVLMEADAEGLRTLLAMADRGDAAAQRLLEAWDGSKHPREDKGSPSGGRFKGAQQDQKQEVKEPKKEPLRIAVADDGMMRDDAQRPVMLEAAKKLGASEVRMIVSHQQTMTEDGWGLIDRMVNDARAAGMKVHLTLATTSEARATLTPGTLTSSNITPAKAAAWMGGVAKRLGGRVSSFGVLNEPNHSRFAGNPEGYGALYRAADKAIRKADPRAQVMFGEMAPYTLGEQRSAGTWLRRAVSKGVRTDGLAIHPYQASLTDKTLQDPLSADPGKGDPGWFSFSQMPQVMDLVRDLARTGKLRTRRGERVPIDGTEFGVKADAADRGRMLSRSVRAAEKYGMRRITFYHLVVQDEVQRAQWDTSLLGPGGEETPASTELVRTIARIRAAGARRIQEEEQLGLEGLAEGAWDETLHPRDAFGRFVMAVSRLSPRGSIGPTHARLPDGTRVTRDPDFTWRVVRNGRIVRGFRTAEEAASDAVSRSARSTNDPRALGGQRRMRFAQLAHTADITAAAPPSAPTSTAPVTERRHQDHARVIAAAVADAGTGPVSAVRVHGHWMILTAGARSYTVDLEKIRVVGGHLERVDPDAVRAWTSPMNAYTAPSVTNKLRERAGMAPFEKAGSYRVTNPDHPNPFEAGGLRVTGWDEPRTSVPEPPAGPSAERERLDKAQAIGEVLAANGRSAHKVRVVNEHWLVFEAGQTYTVDMRRVHLQDVGGRKRLKVDDQYAIHSWSGRGQASTEPALTRQLRIAAGQEPFPLAVPERIPVPGHPDPFRWQGTVLTGDPTVPILDLNAPRPGTAEFVLSTVEQSRASRQAQLDEVPLEDRGPGQQVIDRLHGFQRGGLTVELTSVSRWGYAGRVLNEDGRRVGGFDREFQQGADGRIASVYHSTFSIDHNYRSRGLGGPLVQEMFDAYKAAGLSHVKVSAGLDVGGYMWAKMGFSFANEDDKRSVPQEWARTALPHIRAVAESNGVSGDLIDEFKRALEDGLLDQPWKIARFGSKTPWTIRRSISGGSVEERMWLGKALLLGRSWNGRKDL